MSTENHLTSLIHRDSLADTPLSGIAIPYIEALNAQHYARRTIERHVNCVIHFGCWLKAAEVDLRSINREVIDRSLHGLLLRVSSAAASSSYSIKMARAALRHLFTFLPQYHLNVAKNPIEAELDRLTDDLLNICGMSPQTCVNRRRHVSAFLSYRLSSELPTISLISGADVDAFFQHMALRWRPTSRGTVGAVTFASALCTVIQPPHYQP
jgi:hypothetical protein